MIVLPRPRGWRLLFALRGSVVPRIAPSLAACTALAVAVTLSHGTLFDRKVTLTAVPFSLIGLALAIFLGFRNGAAYDRWWEARKLWGDVVHRSRSLARQLVALVAEPGGVVADGPPAPGDLPDRMVRRLIAFAHALRCQLRDGGRCDDAATWLAGDERAAFLASRRGTEHLLRANARDLARLLHAGRLSAQQAAAVEEHVSALGAAAAGCERIRGTPIPLAYLLLLHRTAYLYCFLLPFGLVDLIGFMTPFVVAIVAYTFFGLDALGDEIEEPFGTRPHHLPLAAMCRTIEIDLLEALGAAELPPPAVPVDGRLT